VRLTRSSSLERTPALGKPTAFGFLLLVGILSVGVAATTGFWLPIMALITLIAVGVASSLGSPTWALSAGLVALTLSITQGIVRTELELPTRVLAIAFLLLPLLRLGGLQNASNSARRLATGFATGYMLYVVGAGLPTGQFENIATHTLGLVVLLAVTWAVLTRVSPSAQMQTISWVVGAAILLSLMGAFLGVPEMVVNGRLLGIFANPNTLGFIAFLYSCVYLLNDSTGFRRYVAEGLALTALVWSGSRTALAATAAMLTVAALIRVRGARSLVAALLLMVSVILILFPDYYSGQAEVVARGNSRATSIEETVRILSTHLFTGIGFGNEAIEIASSPLRAASHAGLLGILGITLMYLALLRWGIRSGGPALALAVGGVVHTLGEGWLLSSLSPLLILYVLALLPQASNGSVSESRLHCGGSP
jgi:hypothetical protein